MHRVKCRSATGWLHNRVIFDDGHSQDIDGTFGSVSVTSLIVGALDLIPPSGNVTLWQARVATGAARACGSMLQVEWRQCADGALLASGDTPVLLDLPTPLGCTLTAGESRVDLPLFPAF